MGCFKFIYSVLIYSVLSLFIAFYGTLRSIRPGWAAIRDTTCRLFGYHGLMNGDSAFSLDHMFGF